MPFLGSQPAEVALTTGDLGDAIVNEAKMNISNSPTNGHMLTAQSGDTGGLTWAAAGGGKVLQVVGASKTDVASTTSTTYADTGLSVAITCAATSSKVLVTGHAVFGTNGNSHYFFAQFVRDSTTLAIGTGSIGSRQAGWIGAGVDNASNVLASGFSYLDSPSSTSELTYKLQFKSQTGTVIYLNSSYSDSDANGSLRSGASIVVMEIGA